MVCYDTPLLHVSVCLFLYVLCILCSFMGQVASIKRDDDLLMPHFFAIGYRFANLVLCVLYLCLTVIQVIHIRNELIFVFAIFGTLAVTVHFQWDRTTPKIAPSSGDPNPPPNTWFFRSPKSTTQTASQLHQPFHYSWAYSLAILYNGWDVSCQNCPLPRGDRESGPWHNTWYLGPTRVDNPNRISIGSAVLHGSCLWLTDRQTVLRQ